MTDLRKDADLIIEAAIREALPDNAVRRQLEEIVFPEGKLVLIAAGKAAWQMAGAAYKALSSRISDGVVITKYGHSRGEIGPLKIFEAAHPVSDENTFRATEAALKCVEGLSEKDSVLFLLSGGGSALFEKPLTDIEEIKSVNRQLLASGASIVEMNTVRKRLSSVKGGKFALSCAPAHVYSIVLSDIIGDPLDMIASGPAYPDSSTCEQALEVVSRYGLTLSDESLFLLNQETPKVLENVTTYVTGSVRQLCKTAMRTASAAGYEPVFLSSCIETEARDAGSFLSSIARDHQDTEKSLAFIAGGETVVHLKGNGLGGRNQELALSAATGLSRCKNTCIFSVGSDGTDGPTDAAGGYCDENTVKTLADKGIVIEDVLNNNDAYHALKECDGLIFTGPTGTNVNDLTVLLIKR